MSATNAIIILQDGHSAAVRAVPMPQLRDEWVLVKVKAISLNPTDWKHIDYSIAEHGCRLGCDYSGIVEDVGRAVSKFKPGDRIAGYVHGGDRLNHENGSFSEIIIAKPHAAFHIPGTMSYAEAATLGVSVATTGLSLYHTLGLPFAATPNSEPLSVLIHAGSTSTALVGIQFAKASGLTVIATCSPHNFDHVRMVGADAVFDYNSPTCASDIKTLTHNKLQYAWDCMGSGGELCAAAMTDTMPAAYVTVNRKRNSSYATPNKIANVQHVVIGYDGLGDDYIWEGELRSPSPDCCTFVKSFFERCSGLLVNERIKPLRCILNKTGSGLSGALRGLDELRAGNVSAAKLVYTL
ncbi:hypothetical protein NUW58_g621 [Xylaria curta]|uniref:Uncharacterized protein n=1 Tax=Xylaria curta TaxID=42375 RepID=A0ACC1PQC3_9PEZI|nr:hypothetical protein NUW58_g621 [Xylaria curta]